MGTDPALHRQNSHQLLQRAADLGINYIDTAPLYGQSELLLGEALAAVAGDFSIATKVGYDPADFDYRADSVLWSLERSLQRLRIDRLAVAQIHEVNMAGWARIMEPGGTLAGLRAAQARGLCQYIGITGRAIPLLAQLAATGEFDTLLVYQDYHPGTTLAAELILPTAAAQAMGVVIGTPLAGGLFVEGPRRATALAALTDEAMRASIDEWLESVAALPGSVPEHAFRFLLADDRVSTVSSGAATVAELEQVAAAGVARSL